MRQTFQKFLFVFMALAFVVAFGLSFYLQTEQAEDNAEDIITLKIEDAKQQLAKNQQNLAIIQGDSDRSAIRKAHACAYILDLEPAALDDRNTLVILAHMLDVDEINVVNGQGIIVASTKDEFIGFDMNSGEQSRYFMRLLDTKTELVQDLQAISYDDTTVMQYAGVRRDQADGFVQIGYTPDRLLEALELADITSLADGFRIGAGGEIIVCQEGVIISIKDERWLGQDAAEYGLDLSQAESGESFDAQINGVDVLCIVADYGDYTIVGTLPDNEMFTSRNATATELIVFNIALFGLVFILISWLVQQVVINGIYSMNHSLQKITEGNLEEKVEVTTNPEFISLSDGINSTVSALKAAIAEAAARIDRELEFAREIQLSALPNVFPPYPDRSEFELYATMHTAREVGGDFYDFFLIGEDRLGLVMADVSGKGVPAALFMMTAKSNIKNAMQKGGDLAEAITTVNNELCANNDAGMFVTVFAAVLNFASGELVYVNAGHNPPLLKRAGSSYEWVKGRHGIILAGLENAQYVKNTLQLDGGDLLFLYTDGVTEALNPAQELYSEPRLEDTLNHTRDLNPADLLAFVKRDIDAFTAGAEQADDITMLALVFKHNTHLP